MNGSNWGWIEMASKNYYANGGIKSKERAAKYAEVFTPEWLVKKMIDDLEKNNGDFFEDPFRVLTATYLDPAVGTGNFPAEILRRKLAICETPLDGVVAISTLYGIDIQVDNVLECRERLADMVYERFGKSKQLVTAVEFYLRRNFVAGNFLTKKLNTGELIWFLQGFEDEQMSLF